MNEGASGGRSPSQTTGRSRRDRIHCATVRTRMINCLQKHQMGDKTINATVPLGDMSGNTEKSSSDVPIGPSSNEDNESDRPDGDALSLPTFVAGSGTLDRLVDTARDYARAGASDNTLKAYAKDWAHFARWCRMKGTEPLPPSPEMIGLYLADLASGSGPLPYPFGQHHRPPPVGPRMELLATGIHPRSQEPANRHGAGRDQEKARASACSEGGHTCRRHPRDGRPPAP